MSLFIGIILVIWTAWGYFAFNLLKKTIEKDLKYLLEPKVNLFKKHSSGGRYDQIELNKWEIYLGAIFLFPIRVILIIITVIIGMSFYVFIWMFYKSKRYF